MRVLGTKGALEMRGGAFHHFRRGDSFCTTEIQTERFNHRNSVAEMVHSVRTGKPFWGTPDHGIAVQRILNGLYESAETGKEVTYTTSKQEPQVAEEVTTN